MLFFSIQSLQQNNQQNNNNNNNKGDAAVTSQNLNMVDEEATDTDNNMQDTLTEKIRELFRICDQDNKGYVTLDDLYRLKDELGLDDKEVENAFEQLDTDKDNFLSLDEFLTGFGLFLGVQQPELDVNMGRESSASDLKPDFTFQVFNLIDKEDKGHITKEDLLDAADTLEIDSSQIDYVYSRLKASSEYIFFEDFVNNIGSIVALSPALQEIKSFEDEKKRSEERKLAISRSFKMDLSGYDDDEIEALLYEQATLLFKQCDHDNKNYVTKDDLLILCKELSLGDDLIQEAFDRLDSEKNGYLTLREFVNGFGLFLGLERDENGNEPILVADNNVEKIRQLFNICDTDNKGYVTRYDLDRLTIELGLPEEQIENIFLGLDSDGDGFITLEEFVQGFSSFMLNDTTFDEDTEVLEEASTNDFDAKYFMDSRGEEDLRKSLSRPPLDRTESEQSGNSERLFVTRQMSVAYESGTATSDDMIDSLENEVGGAISKDQMKNLWNTVSDSGDQVTTQLFENFLRKVYSEIREAKQEARHLETVLEKKAESHNAEIQRIYDEMEVQMQTEKAKQAEQERQKELMLREDLYQTLKDKEKQLDKFQQRQQALENRLLEVKDQEENLKYQNTKLLKENVMLEDKLNDSMSSLENLKSNLQHLEMQTTHEKKETLKAAFQATQGIQYEHENLVKQLDLLKSVNQKLRDDRDTIEASLKSENQQPAALLKMHPSHNGFLLLHFRNVDIKVQKTVRLPSLNEDLSISAGKQRVHRVGSNMDKYMAESSHRPYSSSTTSTSTPTHSPLKRQGSLLSKYFETTGDHVHQDPYDEDERDNEPLEAVQESDREYLPSYSTYKSSVDHTMDDEEDVFHSDLDLEPLKTNYIQDISDDRPTPSSPRRPPVGMTDDDNNSVMSSASLTVLTDPNRIYKIVFVGDSGVGKSSFIHRFCFDDFRPNFTATIGVDYQIKTIKLNRQTVALQLWDTAGQERFRSITKQYFRRADGVVVMFDLSSWSSYTNVKAWMLNIEEGAEPDCVVTLFGNKHDLVASDESLRKVTYESALKLAKDYNADYFEVSARSGEGVSEAMQKMAKKMEMSEDSLMKSSVLNLNLNKEEGAKKKCCR